jgi:hypothetical protein
MAETWGKDYDAFAKALWCLYKSIIMVWRRHPDKKPGGSEAPGKGALKGLEWRWNNCFYPLFLLDKQTANSCFLLCFVSVQD